MDRGFAYHQAKRLAAVSVDGTSARRSDVEFLPGSLAGDTPASSRPRLRDSACAVPPAIDFAHAVCRAERDDFAAGSVAQRRITVRITVTVHLIPEF